MEVPEEHLLGDENGGFRLISGQLRLGAAVDGDPAPAWGDGRPGRCFDHLCVNQRQAFGPEHRFLPGDPAQDRRNGDHGGRRKRLSPYDTLRRFDEGEPVIREVSMTKLMTQRALCGSGDEAPPDSRWLRLHEGIRDRKGFAGCPAPGPTGGGTDEIMKGHHRQDLGL